MAKLSVETMLAKIKASQENLVYLHHRVLISRQAAGSAMQILMAQHEISPRNIAEVTGMPLSELYEALTAYETHPTGVT